MLQSYVVYLGGHSHGQDLSLMDLDGVTNSHYGLLGSILGRYIIVYNSIKSLVFKVQ